MPDDNNEAETPGQQPKPAPYVGSSCNTGGFEHDRDITRFDPGQKETAS